MPILDGDKKISEYVAISKDITHVKGVEERINFFNEHTIISMTDPYGIIIYVNDNFCRISGYSREELIGQPHNIVRHPDMPREIFKNLWDTIQAKKTWNGLVKNRRKDGGHYWVKTTIAPILDRDDNIVQYISVRLDITEHQEADQNLREYEDALTASSMVLKMDLDGVITYANTTFVTELGYKGYELVGMQYILSIGIKIARGFSQLHKEVVSNITEIPTETFDQLWHTIRATNIWKGIIKNRRKNGSFLWCATTIVPMKDSSDHVFEYIVIQTDVTDIEIAKQILKKSFEQLQELDKKKNDFLNIASHELRTPMTAVKGYASMILDGDAGPVSPETHIYIEQIYNSSNRLIQLINDMLDISKLEAGKMTLLPECIGIHKLLREILMDMRQITNKKQQTIVEDYTSDEICYVIDKDKLRQVLINLISNASKFTPAYGTITIQTVIENEELRIVVQDTGIGIAHKDIETIFEKFGQVKNSLTRDGAGTGLGLPIARVLVREMGGVLMVESQVGAGSIFTISLPYTEHEIEAVHLWKQKDYE